MRGELLWSLNISPDYVIAYIFVCTRYIVHASSVLLRWANASKVWWANASKVWANASKVWAYASKVWLIASKVWANVSKMKD